VLARDIVDESPLLAIKRSAFRLSRAPISIFLVASTEPSTFSFLLTPYALPPYCFLLLSPLPLRSYSYIYFLILNFTF
jgi:hypothetical protein